MREGADVEAPLALTSLNSRKSDGRLSTLASLLAGRGLGLKVEKDLVIIPKACSSSSRSCGLWTASRLLPNLCEVFTFFVDCSLFDF